MNRPSYDRLAAHTLTTTYRTIESTIVENNSESMCNAAGVGVHSMLTMMQLT